MRRHIYSAASNRFGRALRALPRGTVGRGFIVLDACTDASEAIASHWCATTPGWCAFAVAHRNVGRSRGEGVRRALEDLAGIDTRRIWVATTDADSVVPGTWLRRQLQLASKGMEAVAGTIRVDDWSEYPQGMADRFARFYEPEGASDVHEHVHGANLGVRADAYLAAGGFEPLPSGEDHALWSALHRASRPRAASRRNPVTTSARRLSRAPEGFSAFLAAFERRGGVAGPGLAGQPGLPCGNTEDAESRDPNA